MGIDLQIEGLEQLVAVDIEIKSLAAELAKERHEIDEIKVEVARLEASLIVDRASVVQMDKTRGELSQDARHLAQQLDRSRERLGRARTERESQAAERELDELRKLHRDREGEITKLITLCDEARNTLDANDARIAELGARLDSSAEGAAGRMATLEAELADRNTSRLRSCAKVGGLTVRRYESMHARGKVPVARTTDGTCLGCYVKLPPMLFHNLMSRTQLDECPNCHRILFYVPPKTPEGEAQESSSS
ncbi:MAG: hypothetical protein EXR75_01690 [Myxococcales bacterium]|nr:hypothetical protein [Myxococcales bacterium]